MTVEIDRNRLREALRKLGAELSDPSDALDAIGMSLEIRIRDNLGDGLDYRGTPFAPLKNPNEKRTGKRPRVSPAPLNNTRKHIYERITHQLEGRDAVSVGMNDGREHIGAVHQFGASIDHHAQSRLQSFKVDFSTGRSRFASSKKANFEQWTSRGAHTVEIPARPFLPISPTGQPDIPQDWEDEIVDIIEAKLRDALA